MVCSSKLALVKVPDTWEAPVQDLRSLPHLELRPMGRLLALSDPLYTTQAMMVRTWR